jgi:hypothetical protein
MRERAKKSPFYVAYTQIDEETFACGGKNFANRLTRICVYVTEPKKSQPKYSSARRKKHVWPWFQSQKAFFLSEKRKHKVTHLFNQNFGDFCETFLLGQLQG